ncbi:MAG TPA: FAD-binding protein, partial [Actinoallomurus sp.]|nr:FAD-binding protein [Actinoallomurus sp.]
MGDVTARLEGLAERLRVVAGAENVITDPAELRTYECDGLTYHRATPGVVVLPDGAEQIAEIVRACTAEGVPYIARGSGTGLSGGALPRTDGVLIVTSRMRRILEIDIDDERAVVEPGVINLDVSKAVRPGGYYYAPD